MTNKEIEEIETRYNDKRVCHHPEAVQTVFALITALRQSNAKIERARLWAFATPGRHADAPCTTQCVTGLCSEIHTALADSDGDSESEKLYRAIFPKR